MRFGRKQRTVYIMWLAILCVVILRSKNRSIHRDHVNSDMEPDKFSVILNGYSTARADLLKKLLEHYCSIDTVSDVFVSWGNPEITPRFFLSSICQDKVTILERLTSSLNARFVPPKALRTNAVLIADDDILVSSRDLSTLFEVWKDHQNRLVGFIPRAIQVNEDGWMYAQPNSSIDIVLTKSMMLHRRFLELYTSSNAHIRAKVDEWNNCEDIAMSFLVGAASGKGPIHVYAQAVDYGDGRSIEIQDSFIEATVKAGLGQRTSHKATRSACVEFLVHAFGRTPPATPYSVIPVAKEKVLCAQHSYMVDCNAHVYNKTDEGEFRRKRIPKQGMSRFAFVTVASRSLEPSILVTFASGLRRVRTQHDIVLVTTDNQLKGIRAINAAYDRVIQMDPIPVPDHIENKAGFSKIYIWSLIEYNAILYIDVDVVVLKNIDSVFHKYLPFAASPDVYSPHIFNSGVMLLAPCLRIYKRMREKVHKFRSYNKGDQGFFNLFFDGWKRAEALHRLPFRLNFVYHLDGEHGYHLPEGWNLTEYIGEKGMPYIVHFANPWSKPWKNIQHDYFQRLWLSDSKGYKFRIPSRLFHLPSKIDDMDFDEDRKMYSRWDRAKAAYVSFFACNGDDLLTGVMLRSFEKIGSSFKFILILDQNCSKKDIEKMTIIDRNVELRKNCSTAAEICSWALVEYDRIIWIKPGTMFLKNMDHIIDLYEPFASLPSSFPPDELSVDLMLIKPNIEAATRLENLRSSRDWTVEKLLRYFVFPNWYRWSNVHHLSPIYHANMDLKKGMTRLFNDFYSISFGAVDRPDTAEAKSLISNDGRRRDFSDRSIPPDQLHLYREWWSYAHTLPFRDFQG